MPASNGSDGPNAARPKKKTGVPHKWSTEEWLDVYRATGDAGRASEAVGIVRRTAYYRRTADAAFRKAWLQAKRDLFERIEESVANRILHGVVQDEIACVAEIRQRDADGKTKVARKFDKVGEKHTYPDVLTIFYMKAQRPEVYSERAMAARALADDPSEVRVEAAVNLRKLSAEGRQALATFLREQRMIEQAETPPPSGDRVIADP